MILCRNLDNVVDLKKTCFLNFNCLHPSFYRLHILLFFVFILYTKIYIVHMFMINQSQIVFNMLICFFQLFLALMAKKWWCAIKQTMNSHIHVYHWFADKLALSRKEVVHLEDTARDLGVQRTRLEESLSRTSDQCHSLETELKNAQCREEQLEEELEVAGSKCSRLEELLMDLEDKVFLVLSFVTI